LADYQLNVGSGQHGEQTARMLSGIEAILTKEKPHAVVVYGDTNSTLAGALAASKLHIPVVHIEAGLRSFNKSMPEEINRITTDHCSTLLFTPTLQGMENLSKEGFDLSKSDHYNIDRPGIFHCGDIMLDNALHFAERSSALSTLLRDLGLAENNFILATVHRDSNTDNPERLKAIFEAFVTIADRGIQHIVLPLHPRTRKMLEKNLSSDVQKRLLSHPYIQVIPPASYLDMIALEKNCSLIITDSGGVQKEAYFFEKPCLILRSETEWVELVQQGDAILCDADPEKIIDGFNLFQAKKRTSFPPIFGDGNAASFICTRLIAHIN
jgi:UDP-GlcNAc3NAcA epimerase